MSHTKGCTARPGSGVLRKADENWHNMYPADDEVISIRYSNLPDIAVVGMACRFPGADDYRQFWENLVGGVCSISEIPDSRWDGNRHFDDFGTNENVEGIRWAGVVRNVAKFDAEFFGIPPQEAQRMDPQQRLMLELTWHCIEDAGYHPEKLSGENVGVFIGAGANEYEELQNKYYREIEEDTATGGYRCMIPNRISYFYNLHGPSVTVDTACSSSLVSIHQAVNAIRSGECDEAFAGGINIHATPTRFNSMSKKQLLSPSGLCKSFDESADGYILSEGAGMLLLKPLDRALADGDNVWGVIRGSAVNHGGRARSLTTPGALAQSRVITSALRNAVVSPSTITYIESHGDGSQLGDSIEVHGLMRAFNHVARRECRPMESHYCAIGAVKPNIGHAGAAAGIASVIKVLLAFKHETLPANMNFSRINPRIRLEDTPFYLLKERRRWERIRATDGSATPLRAGVSAFGMGGVNSHLILEEAPQGYKGNKRCRPNQSEASTDYLLVLSAHTDDSLRRMAKGYAELILDHPERLGDICCAASSRLPMDRRLAIVFNSAEDVINGLEKFAESGVLSPGMFFNGSRQEKLVTAFLFPGEGTQYLDMAKALYQKQPVFRRVMERCDRILASYLPHCLCDVILADDEEILKQPQYEQLAVFAVEYATTELLKSYGIMPDQVMGYGVGEIVAACVAGVFTLEDALYFTARRGELMRRYDGAQVYSSSVMASSQAELFEVIRDIPLAPPRVSVISSVTGLPFSDELRTSRYWVEQIGTPVYFTEAVSTMRKAGANLFLVTGPSSELTTLACRAIGHDAQCTHAFQPNGLANSKLLTLLAELYTRDIHVDLSALFNKELFHKIRLPSYPFGGENYWIGPRTRGECGIAKARVCVDKFPALLGERVHIAGSDSIFFTANLESSDIVSLRSHRFKDVPVLPVAAYIELARTAAEMLFESSDFVIEKMVFHHAFELGESLSLQTQIKQHSDANYEFEVWATESGSEESPDWMRCASATLISDVNHSSVKGFEPLGDDYPLMQDRFYDLVAEKGLNYGAGFKVVESFALRGKHGSAEVALPQNYYEQEAIAGIAPLLDAVFQTVLPLMPSEVFQGGTFPEPVRIEKIRLYDPLPLRLKIRVNLTEADTARGCYRCDFQLFSQSGELSGEISGVSLDANAHSGRGTACA